MKRKVLVVDDEDSVREVFVRAVQSLPDVEVIQARTGKDALSHASRFGPDLVLQDLKLPDTDGLALALALRKVLRPGIPIVCISGAVLASDEAQRDPRSPFVEVVPKPVDLNRLRGIVKRHLRVATDPELRPARPREEVIAEIHQHLDRVRELLALLL